MRNHSHCRRKRLSCDGGECSPQRGRNPDGAKNREINPASSSMPSDWYPEKSCAALTNERKHTQQISNIPRGQILNTKSREAIIPAMQTADSMRGPLAIQSRLGTNQNFHEPADRATACK